MPENQSDLPETSLLCPPARGASKHQQAQHMNTLDTLADGIAGDVSDLFHAVKVSLRLSRADLPDDHVVQDYLNQAFKSLGAAEDVVGQLLALNRTDGGAARERLDLVPLVQEVQSLATSAFPRALTLRTRFDDACTVSGHRKQLGRLVADVVTTAGQSMRNQWHERPTVLDISVRRLTADAPLAEQYLPLETGQYVHLAVSATGGSPAEKEPAGRAGAPPTDEPDGADPDLAVARSIVEAHDGALTVRTESGEGTTFNVYLPLATDGPPAAPTGLPTSAPNQHVLVVDDDKTVRTLEGLRLSRLGCEVTQKANAEAALAAIQAAPGAFDVALIDYHMPDMNGLELVHALRTEKCEASVALMTGLSAQLSAEKARIVGVDHLLYKPVERRELAELLAQLG